MSVSLSSIIFDESRPKLLDKHKLQSLTFSDVQTQPGPYSNLVLFNLGSPAGSSCIIK